MTSRRCRFQPYLVAALLAAFSRPAFAQTGHDSIDPVTTDPHDFDPAFPPRAAELAIDSKGSRLNGFFYLAAGKQAHPTVILLHGLPGSERNSDLAQALRRAGLNVLVFSYRGAWGNGGTFSFAHALEDVAAAVAFIRSDSSVSAFRVDPRRLVLAGHSMGGWLALMRTAADPAIRCVAALDFWNAGAHGRRMRSEGDTGLTRYINWLTAPGGPLQVEDTKRLMAEMQEQTDLWDPERQAASLSSRPILLISTTENASHPRLVAALKSAHAEQVRALQWRTDHSFSDHRIQLARTMVDWLRDRCGA